MSSNIDQIFAFLIILIIVTALGLMYKSWLEKKQGGKDTSSKREEILTNMLKKKEGDYQKRFGDKQLDELKSLLAKDFSLLVRGIPYRIDGVNEAMKWLQKAMEEASGQSIFDQKATLINQDAAIVTFNWLRGGSSGKTTHIWRYDDREGWELLHEHTSYNPSEK